MPSVLNSSTLDIFGAPTTTWLSDSPTTRISSRPARSRRRLLDSWGEKQGLEYFRRLAKQDVLIRSGYTLQAQLLAAGEVELVPWSHAQRPLLMADSGAPLGVTFLEPVQSKAQVLLLARRSPHPNAAALFI